MKSKHHYPASLPSGWTILAETAHKTLENIFGNWTCCWSFVDMNTNKTRCFFVVLGWYLNSFVRGSISSLEILPLAMSRKALVDFWSWNRWREIPRTQPWGCDLAPEVSVFDGWPELWASVTKLLSIEEVPGVSYGGDSHFSATQGTSLFAFKRSSYVSLITASSKNIIVVGRKVRLERCENHWCTCERPVPLLPWKTSADSFLETKPVVSRK